jgi:acyl-CoA thioesterase I
MSQKRRTLNNRINAGAALVLLTGFAAAHAEVPASTHVLTRAAIPATTPAAVTSPVRPASAKPLQPAVLHPVIAPLAPGVLGCSAPAELRRLDRPLLHTAKRLASGKPLTIVAVGSSSTAGAGASSPAASYPSRLAVELKKLFPGRSIKVINRGVNGEETPDMMARFSTGVIAEHPQLVLWQLGTNSVLRDHPLKPHLALLRKGIAELRAAGADVVLIDPQYAPKVLAKPETPGMVDLIALVAREQNVDLFQRFAVMRDWYETEHASFKVFVSPDGLHMNDWGYACWAKLLAASIANAANLPVASAAEGVAP